MLPPAERRNKIKGVLGVASGAAIEVYDFIIYAFYATYVAAAFFPADSQFISLMLSLVTFGVTALMRPLGALLIGSYADRKGRRAGLLLSLSLMAAGTFMLAATPTYATIGLLAPFAILLARMVQGFAFGGEIGSASTYLSEIATPGNRGLYTSATGMSSAMATIFAAIIGVTLTSTLTREEMSSWGMRIPFIAGCLAIPLLFWMRRSLDETEVFKKSRPAQSSREILRIIGEHWQIVALCLAVNVYLIVAFYFVAAYTPTYASTALRLDPLGNLAVSFCVGIAILVFSPVGGALSDRIGRWPVLLCCPLLTILTAYPATSWLVAEPSFERLLVVEVWLSIFQGAYYGTVFALYAEIMPPKVRASGMSLAISLANGLFGSFTPAISTLLIEVTGDKASPALWLSACAAISFAAVFAARRLNPRTSVEVVPT